ADDSLDRLARPGDDPDALMVHGPALGELLGRDPEHFVLRRWAAGVWQDGPIPADPSRHAAAVLVCLPVLRAPLPGRRPEPPIPALVELRDPELRWQDGPALEVGDGAAHRDVILGELQRVLVGFLIAPAPRRAVSVRGCDDLPPPPRPLSLGRGECV